MSPATSCGELTVRMLNAGTDQFWLPVLGSRANMPSAVVEQTSSSWPASFLRIVGTEYDVVSICRSVRQRILPSSLPTAATKLSLGSGEFGCFEGSCEQLTTTMSS